MALPGDNDKSTPTTTQATGQAGVQPPPKSRRDLLSILTHAASEVVNLKILTVVSPVQVGGTIENPTVAFDQGQKVGAIATCINLLDGDITTAMDAAYSSNVDDPVRQYHEAQVKEAKEIVDRNLKTLADLIERIGDKLA